MAKLAGLNQWVNRTTREFVQQTSSGEMERRFPAEVFHDAEGEPTSNANWIHAPDLLAVAGFPNIYWKITRDVVSLMSLPERNAVDAANKSAGRDNSIAGFVDGVENPSRQLVKTLIAEINTLRQLHGLPPLTLAQVRNQLRSGLGT